MVSIWRRIAVTKDFNLLISILYSDVEIMNIELKVAVNLIVNHFLLWSF